MSYDYDLIVIGTGAAGSVAAHIVAAAGKKVAIVEKDAFGGDCPNWSDIPVQALLHVAKTYYSTQQATKFGIRSATVGYNYPTIRAWKDTAIQRTGTARGKATFESGGINVLRGTAQFASSNEVIVGRRYYSAARFMIATGATATKPAIKGLDDTPYLTPREAIDLLKPPKSLFIIGGGATSCEFAELFSIFGSKVTIAEAAPRLLPQEDHELGNLLATHFSEQGVHVLTNARVTKIEHDSLQKRVHFRIGGKEQSVKVDEILLAAGRTPMVDIDLEQAGVRYSPQGIIVDEFLQTNARHIFAAGDVLGQAQFTHAAVHQGRIVANNILHRQKMAVNTRAIPRVIFTNPEIAAIGLTETAAIKYAVKYRMAMSPVSLIGRANVSDEHQGLVKIITDREGRLLGGAIVAPHASEMIHELALAIQLNATAADLANLVHAFPTWSEAIRIACSKLN